MLRALFLIGLSLFAAPAAAQDRLAVFDEVTATVEAQFFDPALNGLDWKAVAAEHRARITADMDREAFAADVNALLGRLEASHTMFLTKDSPKWYQLSGIFLQGGAEIAEKMAPYLSDGVPLYAGIGVFTEDRPEGWFVTGVFDGHPADKAGILLGDRIVSVEGEPYHPIRSFAGRQGTQVRLSVERRPGEVLDLVVTPAMLNGITLFREAMTESARIIERDGAKVGYIHAWSYAGKAYQEILRNAVLFGELKEADALVLDVRGGWGGASPDYLGLFAKRGIEVTGIRRDGSSFSFGSGWTKPVVLLVDKGTTSGKELLAHGVRALGIGPVVGERTAGAVLAGRFNVLSDGSLLYLAVNDVRVDGVRLEGRGVAPDVEVPFDPAYAAGRDPQLEKAVEVATGLARQD